MAFRQANRRRWLGRRREPTGGGDWPDGSFLLTDRLRKWIDRFVFFLLLPLEDDCSEDLLLLLSLLLLLLLLLLELVLELLAELLSLLLLSPPVLSEVTNVSIHGCPEATRSIDSTMCCKSQVILVRPVF